jgi:hypothetical protein
MQNGNRKRVALCIKRRALGGGGEGRGGGGGAMRGKGKLPVQYAWLDGSTCCHDAVAREQGGGRGSRCGAGASGREARFQRDFQGSCDGSRTIGRRTRAGTATRPCGGQCARGWRRQTPCGRRTWGGLRGRAAALEVSIEERVISSARVTGTIECAARAAAPWANVWPCRRQFRSTTCAAEGGKRRAGSRGLGSHAMTNTPRC